jgi:type I restriction enzyme R subunit
MSRHSKATADQPSAFPPALPDVLKVPPISEHGNVAEIAQRFGGFDQLGKAVTQLHSLLYAA